MSEACSVLIAANDLLPALRPRAAIAEGELLTFTDTEALRALEAIGTRRPRLVALERQFAATPRGAALINRIKADRALDQTEIRVLSHDSDFSRVVPRAPAPAGSAPAKAASNAAPAVVLPRTEPSTTATMEPPALDESGTRRAPRFIMADKVDVLIDGNAATLVEMSICGAHVVSPTILKPNQRVRLVLTDEAGTVRVNASIAWASFEIPPSTGPRYRAGLDFVDGDVALLGAYCHRHKA